jgi:type II secretory pathway pseudopilin PulG
MRADSESGFSLLELLVAALMTVGLLGAIFALTSRNQQVFVTESGVIDMNQNARTCIDLMTRDIQSAGVGLPSGVGNFAAIFYTDGEGGAPDSIMMLNGDPFAPVADVTERAAGSAEFFVIPPPGVDVTGNGSNQVFTYTDPDGNEQPIYTDFETDDRTYIVYDETDAMIFKLTQSGQIVGNGGGERLKLQHNPQSYLNPASVFGTPLTASEPDYGKSRVAMLGSTVAYRLDADMGELMRTEDLTNWFAVARGVVDFQLQYRVLLRNDLGAVEEKITERPGWDLPGEEDTVESGKQTSRRDIRSVIITIETETPDVPPGNPSYRRSTYKFEVTPRNLNLVNNNNLVSK